jgi:hypothetical protein
VPIPEDERIHERVDDPRIDDQRIDDQLVNDQRVDHQLVNDPPIDEKFEARLKQFRPLAPQSLQVESRVRPSRRWFLPAAWAAAAVGVVAVAVLTYHARPGRVAAPVERVAIVDQLVQPQPLTIGTANALLATAPSFKSAIDGMAFPSKPAPLPADKHSALAELSKEKIKL